MALRHDLKLGLQRLIANLILIPGLSKTHSGKSFHSSRALTLYIMSS